VNTKLIRDTSLFSEIERAPRMNRDKTADKGTRATDKSRRGEEVS